MQTYHPFQPLTQFLEVVPSTHPFSTQVHSIGPFLPKWFLSSLFYSSEDSSSSLSFPCLPPFVIYIIDYVVVVCRQILVGTNVQFSSPNLVVLISLIQLTLTHSKGFENLIQEKTDTHRRTTLLILVTETLVLTLKFRTVKRHWNPFRDSGRNKRTISPLPRVEPSNRTPNDHNYIQSRTLDVDCILFTTLSQSINIKTYMWVCLSFTNLVTRWSTCQTYFYRS